MTRYIIGNTICTLKDGYYSYSNATTGKVTFEHFALMENPFEYFVKEAIIKQSGESIFSPDELDGYAGLKLFGKYTLTKIERKPGRYIYHFNGFENEWMSEMIVFDGLTTLVREIIFKVIELA